MSRSSQSLRWYQQDTAMKDLTNDSNNISYTDGNTIPQVSRFHEVLFDQPKLQGESKRSGYKDNNNNNTFQQSSKLQTSTMPRSLAAPQIQIFQKPSFASPVQLSKRISESNKIPKEQFHQDQDGFIQQTQLQKQQPPLISPARLNNDQSTRQREASFGAGSNSFMQIPNIIVNPPQQHQYSYNNTISPLQTQLSRIKEEQLISLQSDRKSLGRFPSQLRFEDALRKYEVIQSQQTNKNQFYPDRKRNNLDLSQSPQDALKMIVMSNESDTQNGEFNYQSYQQLCQQLGLHGGGSSNSEKQLWNLLCNCCSSGSTVSTQLLYQILQVILDSEQYNLESATKAIKTICMRSRRIAGDQGNQKQGGGEEDEDDKEDIVLSSLISPDMVNNLRQNQQSRDWMKTMNIQAKKDSNQSQGHGQKQFEQQQKMIPMAPQHQRRQPHSKETSYVHTQLSENGNSNDGGWKQNSRNISNSHHNNPISDMSNMLLDSARTVSREHYLQESSVHRRLFCDAESKVDKLAEYLAEKEKNLMKEQREQCTFTPQINKNTAKFLARSKSSMIRQTNTDRDNSQNHNTSRRSARGQRSEASVCEAVKGASETVRRMEAARKIKDDREQFWEKERIMYDERNKKKERLKEIALRDRQRGSVNNQRGGRGEEDINNGRETLRTHSDNRISSQNDKTENNIFSKSLIPTMDNQKDNSLPRKATTPPLPLPHFPLASNNSQLSLSTSHRQPTPRKISSSSQSAKPSLTPARDTKLFFSRHGNPMLYVDVNISMNRSCKIALYEGDLPETIAEEFAMIYQLSQKQTQRLIDKLVAVLDQYYGGGQEQSKK